MTPQDKPAFAQLMTDAMAFYRQDVSTFALGVWWEACHGFSFEQVAKALTAHAMDPQHGRFAPKPADIVLQLQGTKTDRSRVAWGKVLDAMQRVGAYTSVVFDDGVIHAAIEDIGGWVEICRGEMANLPHVERRFCEAYRAYSGRGDLQFPAFLPGAHQLQNATKGHRSAPPVLIGNPQKAKEVARLGINTPKTQITHVLDSVEQLRIGVKA